METIDYGVDVLVWEFHECDTDFERVNVIKKAYGILNMREWAYFLFKTDYKKWPHLEPGVKDYFFP